MITSSYNITIHKDSQGHTAAAFAQIGVYESLDKALYPAQL